MPPSRPDDDYGDRLTAAQKTPYDRQRDNDNPDPWRHRSPRMRCETCMWFVLKILNDSTAVRPTLGRCRRHAPTMSGFPAVFMQDWCGDHKLDENKV